jgi:hypothetical protein
MKYLRVGAVFGNVVEATDDSLLDIEAEGVEGVDRFSS